MKRSTKAPRRGRGRSWVALVLLAFVAVSAAVIWRRGYGVTRAVELRRLDRQRMQLLAQRASLQRRLHELTSRQRLVPLVESELGMRIPADTQVIVMPATPHPTHFLSDHAAP
jgi:hypothetical protein